LPFISQTGLLIYCNRTASGNPLATRFWNRFNPHGLA